MFMIRHHAPSTFAAKRTGDLQNLSLPMIEIDRKTKATEFWDIQNYQKFAENVQRKNPDIVLTKETVDSAFRLALNRMSKNSATLKGRESAVARVSHNG
jgi:hypothetical protein